MARLLANTLEGPDRDRIAATVMDAVNAHRDAGDWNVLILRIRGISSVFVSIESAERVLRSWLFNEADGRIGDRILWDLPRPEELPAHTPASLGRAS
jgi:hypothetical protein